MCYSGVMDTFEGAYNGVYPTMDVEPQSRWVGSERTQCMRKAHSPRMYSVIFRY